MKYLIISNNPRVIPLEKQIKNIYQARCIEGTVKDVVFLARDMILGGMKLAADPLAGRRQRVNPYLTIILSKEKQGKVFMDHILRLEKMLEIYYDNRMYFDQLAMNQYKDYAILDQELTKSALDFI